jgi:recombination protein RecA
MGAAVLRKHLEIITGSPLAWRERPAPETLPTGVAGVDLPRGCLTEICGPASSGRTSLLFAALARATAAEEFCALIDTADSFDPASAAAAGVDLARVLWVRCGGNAETALKATDLLTQGGGFGVVALDLGDTPSRAARRISLTSWFRLRRAVEHTPTVLVALEREPNARTCATMVLEIERERAVWQGKLLKGLRVRVVPRKPAGMARLSFDCGAASQDAAGSQPACGWRQPTRRPGRPPQAGGLPH